MAVGARIIFEIFKQRPRPKSLKESAISRSKFKATPWTDFAADPLERIASGYSESAKEPSRSGSLEYYVGEQTYDCIDDFSTVTEAKQRFPVIPAFSKLYDNLTINKKRTKNDEAIFENCKSSQRLENIL